MDGITKDSQLLIYQSPDGAIKIEVRLEDETVWLTLNQMAELFQIDKSGIRRHLKNIYWQAIDLTIRRIQCPVFMLINWTKIIIMQGYKFDESI